MSAGRLLRPDQAAAALAMAQAGSPPVRIAEALVVPLEVVERSLRVPPTPVSERMVRGPVLVVGARAVAVARPRPVSGRAPIYVEDDLAWPPSATDASRWYVLPVLEGSEQRRVPCREVTLWGRQVMVDAARRVFCVSCLELVDVVAMGRDQFRGEDGVLGGGLPAHRLAMPNDAFLGKPS